MRAMIKIKYVICGCGCKVEHGKMKKVRYNQESCISTSQMRCPKHSKTESGKSVGYICTCCDCGVEIPYVAARCPEHDKIAKKAQENARCRRYRRKKKGIESQQVENKKAKPVKASPDPDKGALCGRREDCLEKNKKKRYFYFLPCGNCPDFYPGSENVDPVFTRRQA